MEKNAKPKFDKSSPELVRLLDKIAPSDPDLVRKPMFGWPAFFADGKHVAGLFREGLVLRLSEEDRAAILRHNGAENFAPMPGRVMTGYVLVKNPLEWSAAELRDWVERSLAHVRSLPAKAQKKAPKKSAAAAKKRK